MAACAHVWHYSCVARLIHTPQYPIFQCPNCRATTDLSAEVDDSTDLDEIYDPPVESAANTGGTQNSPLPAPADDTAGTGTGTYPDVGAGAGVATGTPAVATESHPNNIVHTTNIPIPDSPERGRNALRGPCESESESRSGERRHEHEQENPMTPRNDLGMLALDGRAGRL